MSAQWKYSDDCVAYADGTGNYDEGWYAASPSLAETGQSPEAGPFATREAAEEKAKELAREEAS